ncbi:MFS transporter [Amycolatopsis sp. YIM 10]|uniref:MFS transporter n=1 Tax=Amycolatopsis sp. YIM 10 TaxID=2653857 RepID=UPI00128FDD65|nr:MFS transporter [Amycolatopsis sp. YIM 10]QFU90244.1 enterobactin exporter EntS [Amycolatopsis sp. YIM 10]
MRVFNLIWAGQGVSLIGSAMTTFGIGVWVFLDTGSPTYFATLVLAASLPALLVLPVAGALVDRWDRRRVMLLSDTGAALAPAGVVLLHTTGALQLWHVYVLVGIGAVFKAFQWPAFSALVPQLVDKDNLGKANGRVSLIEAAGQVFGALLGGGLYALIGLRGLLVVDLLTLAAALGTLLYSFRWLPVEPPRPRGDGPATTHRDELLEGWRFIRERPGLLGILLFFAANNLVMEMAIVLVGPLVLSTHTPADLGLVNAIGWTGMTVVSLAISMTRGPRRLIRAILTVATCHAVLVLAMGIEQSVWMLAAGMFGILGGYAVTNAASATLWQLKTPQDKQGRVFAIRRMVAWSAEPIAYGLAGPIAQLVGTPLAQRLDLGQGGGIAVVFLLVGPALLLVVALTWLRPRVRHAERELPDAIAPPALKV